MDTSDDTTRTGTLWAIILRRLVLGAFACTVVVVVLLIGMAVLSATGTVFDPHGYRMLAGILFGVGLTPVALALWLLHRAMT